MIQKILSRYYRVVIQIDDSGNVGDYETAEFQFEQDAYAGHMSKKEFTSTLGVLKSSR